MSKLRETRTLDLVVAFVGQHRQDHGYPPTYVEIAEHAGISVSGAHGYVVELVGAGRLAKTAGLARSIVVVEQEGS